MRSKAVARGDQWDLSFEVFQTFWDQPCFYCGAELRTAHLDRIDPRGAYTCGNVVSCCPACNRGKGDQDQAEFLARCRAVAKANPKAIWSMTID